MSFLGGAPTLGGANPSAGAKPNILAAIFSALGQAPSILMQQQQQQQQLKAMKQQNEMQPQLDQMQLQMQQASLQQQQRTNDQSDWERMRSAFINNPAARNDQYAISRAQEIAGRLGQPFTLDAAGHVDPNQFLKDSTQADPKAVEYLLSLPGGQVRDNAAKALGIRLTPQQIAGPSAMTPKDTATLMRAKDLGVHQHNLDVATAKRTQIAQYLADSQGNLNDARRQSLIAGIQTGMIRANAAMTAANAAQYRAQTARQTLEFKIQAFNSNPNGGAQRIVNDAAGKLVNEGKALDAQIDSVTNAIEKADGDGVGLDPSNPSNPNSMSIIDNLNARLEQLKKEKAAVAQSITQANEALATNVAHAGDVKSASGAHGSITVTDTRSRSGIDISQARESRMLTSGPYKGQRAYLMPDGHVHLSNGTDLGKL